MLAANDVYNLVICLWREMRGGTKEEMRGVYWVIVNRSNDPAGRWPKNISKVILQPKQFSSFNKGDINYTKYPQPLALSTNVTYVVDNPGDDPTRGATHYINLPEGSEPVWATPDKLTIKIGSTRFYKL